MTAQRASSTTIVLGPVLGPVLGIMLSLLPAHRAFAADSAESGDASGAAHTEGSAGGEGGSEAAPEGAKEGEAEEGKSKLSDRIKAVERKAFLKKSRLELFPHFALDLNDPFFQHYLVGAAVGFHVADSLAFELRGGAVVASSKSSAIRFVRQATDSLLKNPPELKYHADLDFVWAPIYGKISLFSESILHFDTYLTAGPGVFGTDSGVDPSVNFGIGQRYFINHWLVARLELRDYVYMDSRNNESNVRQSVVLGFSLSGFFPTTFEYEYQ